MACQDVSAAGKRAGIKDGTRSGLWLVFAEAIDALRPRWVVIENVRGLLSADGEPWPPEVVAAAAESHKWSRVLDLIQRKLNRAQRKGNWDNEYIRRKRYEAARVAGLKQRAVARFRALRSRLVQRAIGTVVAELSRLGYDAQWSVVSAAQVGAPHRRERVFILASAADAASVRPGEHHQPLITGIRAATRRSGEGTALAATDAPRNGWHQGRPESARLIGGSDASVRCDGAVDLLPTPRKPDGDGGANPLDRAERMDDVETRVIRCAGQWGKYAPAITRWEAVLGRSAPAPTEPNRNGKPRLNPAFSEWMMGWPASWVTDPAIGISRNDQLRIVGNGVVTLQAVAGLRYLLAVEAAA